MINEFEKLGLSNYESRIIVALGNNRISLQELSKASKVPFGKIYSVVKKLREKGLVEENNSRPKLIYLKDFSEKISNLIEEKKSTENILFENIRNFCMSVNSEDKHNNKNFFEIGTTLKDNERIQLRSFVEAEEEVFQIINIHHKPKANRKSKILWEKEITKAIKRGVIFKSVYPVKCKLPKLIQELNKKSPEKFQIKRLDTDFTRMDIIDSKKVLIKFVSEDITLFGGILFIENERLAENLKRVFEAMWEEAN